MLPCIVNAFSFFKEFILKSGIVFHACNLKAETEGCLVLGPPWAIYQDYVEGLKAKMIKRGHPT